MAGAVQERVITAASRRTDSPAKSRLYMRRSISSVVSASDPLVDRQVGNYRVLEPLGKGRTGRVYRVCHSMFDGRVAAMKVISNPDKGIVERFLREAQATERIRHPNVVQVTDCGADGKILYLVMEYLRGTTLARTLMKSIAKSDSLPDLRRVQSIVTQVCRGLAAAHEQGLIHRDVKPENIMLGDGDIVKILDFGLVKDTESGQRGQLTQVGTAVGTPEYMSPEQARGIKVDHRSDIYSLGVVLYELITGLVPFEGANDIETMQGHIEGELIPPSIRRPDLDIPLDMEQVAMHALERDPKRRFQSVLDLEQALLSCRSLEETQVVRVRKFIPPERLDTAELPAQDKSARKVWRRIATGAALVVAAAAGIIMAFTGNTHPSVQNQRPALSPVAIETISEVKAQEPVLSAAPEPILANTQTGGYMEPELVVPPAPVVPKEEPRAKRVRPKPKDQKRVIDPF